jgi:hypothetical protein
MKDEPNLSSSELCATWREPGTQSSFVEMIRAQHYIERLNRTTGECALISIDEALRELSGCHKEPLELLIQRVVLRTPWAFYRLRVEGTYLN